MLVLAQFLIAAMIGGLAGVGASYLLRTRPRYAWPELDDLEDRITRLERSHRMLQGRLNGLHPPRAGTGAEDGDGAVEVAVRPPTSRQALLVDHLRRMNARDK